MMIFEIWLKLIIVFLFIISVLHICGIKCLRDIRPKERTNVIDVNKEAYINMQDRYRKDIEDFLEICDDKDDKVDKYKTLVTNTQKSVEKKNKELKAQKKGMKKLQKRYQKLLEENKCLRMQLKEKKIEDDDITEQVKQAIYDVDKIKVVGDK